MIDLFLILGSGFGVTSPGLQAHDHIDVDWSNRSEVWTIGAGARWWHFGIEGGYIRLPRYEGHAHTDDYPAYKGIPDPVTVADITQTISAQAWFVRGMVYGPRLWRVTPYGFYGAAWVRAFNHEWGSYDNAEAVDWQINLQNTNKDGKVVSVPYYGGGLQVDLSKHWAIRAEVAQIPQGTSSYWTGSRTYTFGTLSVAFQF